MTGGTRRRIVVSTLAEARFFADGGFDDILYAYPLPFDKVEECAALAERLESFQVLVDSPEALDLLKRRNLNQGRRWKVWLKIDCENGRGALGLLGIGMVAAPGQGQARRDGGKLGGIWSLKPRTRAELDGAG